MWDTSSLQEQHRLPKHVLLLEVSYFYPTNRILPGAAHAYVDGIISGAAQAPADRVFQRATHTYADGILPGSAQARADGILS
jgi:hypothetical protein